jgi:hypothetical protein
MIAHLTANRLFQVRIRVNSSPQQTLSMAIWIDTVP